MGRAVPNRIRILTVIAGLALLPGCNERALLEKEAPALARANLHADRIAIAGVVSDVAALGDSAENRARWSLLIESHLGRERFGKLPIVSFSEVQGVLGRDEHGLLLDRYKDDGGCDAAVLADLHTVLDDRARFLVFANIQDDQVERSESVTEIVDNKTKKTTSKTKTMTTSRTTWVRLRFYDLSDQQLVWEHLAVGQSSTKKDHDMTDVIEHDPKEGFLSGLITSIANSALKPEPQYPPAPELEGCLADAFDDVGAYLKPSKKK